MTVRVTPQQLEHWRRRQARQRAANLHAAEQARREAQQIAELLAHEYGATRVVLFGSLTKGKFREDSDIDLAVEGTDPAAYFSVLSRIGQLSERWVDLKLIEDMDEHFLKRVLETGEILYARPI